MSRNGFVSTETDTKSATRDTHLSLDVHACSGTYPVLIGPDLLNRGELWRPYLTGRQVLVVTNDTVAPLYLDRVRESLTDLETDVVVLPDGEQYKTLESASRVWDQLIENRFERDCTLVALGGGVVGDLTGFVAACYQRGVGFLPMPTTLLAQTDASVGGKTAVNHPRGKNLIGAFHQPRCVVTDTDTLESLPERELRAGLAEVIKYGLIRDEGFVAWLETGMEKILERDPSALGTAIEQSCRHKAEVVAKDEREQGIRALLNFGHTFAHAIETATGYALWLHGEAVGLGMRLAGRLSAQTGTLASAQLERLEHLLDMAGVPDALPPGLDAGTCLELMRGDKKVRDGRLRLVLLRDIGEAFITSNVDPNTVTNILREAQCS